MKRIILTAMALALVFALCACGGGGGTPTPSPTQPTASTPSQDGGGRGDTFDDSQIPAGADDVITQGVFYYELSEMSGDYGDGLSPREGAELVNDLLADIGFYSGNGIRAGQCVYISFDELSILDSAMGRECYIYSVGIGTAEGGLMGNDYQVVYRVSVDYSGNKTAAIYEDFSSEYNDEEHGDMSGSDPGDGEYYEPNDDGWNGGGHGDVTGSDPGDGELVAWWGTYVSSGHSLDISEVTGESFYYAIRMITTTQNTVVAEGRAKIDETGYFATSDGMGFSLYEDLSAIDIFTSESSEWAELRGQYERLD